MGRLIVSAQMTADAVMDQNDQWFDAERESEQHGADQLRAADALLLGRETYEFFSSVWPTMTGDPGGFADQINGLPKYVASRTLQGPLTWNARLLEGDVPERVAELKRELPGNLLSYGFGELAHSLACHGLVDEVRFWLHPVVWGEGLRPIENGRSPVRMRLIGATTFSSGVVLVSYQPLGG
ncbi:dihydrofolate reductase family protein [Actinoallomurus sp. NBC_01490]|jgi:dihydrofolate reductase|uniref:dihydrofolate reductase family protein n=1 Tax=Actinoallomurus sp. NBC_01490 TaxID=2903557 RepID=UPI002E35EF6D|nr:dihydrofolate reductase family protein [Actinoallomurus sp. NBC_01490]